MHLVLNPSFLEISFRSGCENEISKDYGLSFFWDLSIGQCLIGTAPEYLRYVSNTESLFSFWTIIALGESQVERTFDI